MNKFGFTIPTHRNLLVTRRCPTPPTVVREGSFSRSAICRATQATALGFRPRPSRVRRRAKTGPAQTDSRLSGTASTTFTRSPTNGSARYRSVYMKHASFQPDPHHSCCLGGPVNHHHCPPQARLAQRWQQNRALTMPRMSSSTPKLTKEGTIESLANLNLVQR